MEVLMGKTSINGPFSMAMLNNQMVSLQNGDLSTLNQENMGGWAAMAK
jgi:hypothetical protein